MGLDSASFFTRHSPDPESCHTDGKRMVLAPWEGIVLFTPPLCDLNTHLVYLTLSLHLLQLTQSHGREWSG